MGVVGLHRQRGEGPHRELEIRPDARRRQGSKTVRSSSGRSTGRFSPRRPTRFRCLPKFTFPTTLDEQFQALQDNPLVKRFAEARARSAGNPHKPIYHFVQPEGYLNDPNGISFWRGKWHLFYQWIPPETNNQLHWGHAYSDDLVHWKDLPPAIYPGPEQGSWSGSVYLEENRAIAAYFGNECGVMIATVGRPAALELDENRATTR